MLVPPHLALVQGIIIGVQPTGEVPRSGSGRVVGPEGALPSVSSMVWRFAASGLVVLAAILLATTQISQDLGQQQAVGEARQISRLTGQGIIQPLLTQEVLAGRPAALTDLNKVVRDSVIRGQLIRVKLWNSRDEVLYSDESRLIGERYPDDADRRQARDSGQIGTGISGLTTEDNRYERGSEELLQVYVPLQAETGETVLYQASFQLDGVRDAGRRAWLAFAPVTVGALLVLQLVQIPLAWTLAKRIRSDAHVRERLLQRSLDASESERRHIAADLHDGVVQELAGVSYSLSAAGSAEPDGPIAEGARDIRASVRRLRSLLVDIYPPDLASAGLGPALQDLLARHDSQGRSTTLKFAQDVDLDTTTAGLIYRIASEGLRNVAKHADASSVHVTFSADDDEIYLRIRDDGKGFAVTDLEREDGHFGMRILRDTAAALNGRLVVRSSPGGGTDLELQMRP